MVKTVSPAVLCNEITMDGLQWLFIPKLHSDSIRLREDGGKGVMQEGVDGGIERKREQTAGPKSSQEKDVMQGNGRSGGTDK